MQKAIRKSTQARALAHEIDEEDAKMTGSYSYQVRACDASGACSEWSDAITVHVFREGPPTLTVVVN